MLSPEIMYKPNIITVEDDKDISATLQTYFHQELEIDENQMKFFPGAEEASEYLEHTENIPDVAFINIHLSQGTEKAEGLDIIRRLKENKRFEKTKIVAITGDPLLSIEEKCKAEGADFISKPFDLEEIKKRVADASQKG